MSDSLNVETSAPQLLLLYRLCTSWFEHEPHPEQLHQDTLVEDALTVRSKLLLLYLIFFLDYCTYFLLIIFLLICLCKILSVCLSLPQLARIQCEFSSCLLLIKPHIQTSNTFYFL